MAIMKRKQKVSDEIPTSSMADIAFLLLVFFLTTTVFNEERGLPIVLPEQAEEQDVSGRNLIFFIVQPDGRVIVRRGESEQEQVVAHTQVANILRTELAGNENLIAAIQTHPNAPYRHMVNVLDEVKLAGAERISLQEMEN
ncbi:MAG: biopolymer transporter ExbD [Gemmatimonadales bacterium]|jgi:biopolymer transport protein ExbD|uniref:ExbD/TolR family protein n=2 Tax=Candidatus Palauibacteraceae TaxID=3056649 RepID=UPI00137D74E1|nr:biopolymer transporter ExbD [Candidatus Palauibacter polyketidifaciens]MCY3699799.1 biopolymer transporter ExbD [Gemmatimonadota bacterium]MXX67396.1 biopolymer transporter ExbD [Gemmatimonadales bacterium]MDE2721400.1 biopolymer transporter ExbD [Candidatus Palauibacter polyketidifaciens]MYE33916.1 biopolymer transporter ExbD [Gemmatimonadales bacterium]MYG19334.1 biopolymer transporter ExbD [Gemmatimonadales bacterium]